MAQHFHFRTRQEAFGRLHSEVGVSEALEGQFGAASESGLVWKPQNTIEVGEAQAGTLLKLLDTLDDNDDVQNIASNFDIPDDVLARLA